ncbi:hypothetical protein H4R99_008315 [Coemansia sp. RSA 1722]|nr:hypothetical protein H4R99_008315 [Coemansia sp. RSA 1722]
MSRVQVPCAGTVCRYRAGRVESTSSATLPLQPCFCYPASANRPPAQSSRANHPNLAALAV